MTDVLYEHPLNEKVRTYLRLEHLLRQVQYHAQASEAADQSARQQAFFTSFFALLDVLERSDVRPDLLKDIERCEQALVTWSKHPSVSNDALQQMLQKAVRLQSELNRSGKLGSPFKDDAFLAPIRQRFAMPGGACAFDVPQLHYWCHQPQAEQSLSQQKWLDQIELSRQSIDFVLTFARERGQFQQLEAVNGFYQNTTDQYELLRLKYDSALGVYPTVSGNKYRFAIRFMQLSDANGRLASEKTIPFALACC
ncbi:cell division protein ZapD [Alkalimonas delamerensis]|uniref:Cell division protein ZapD n=1 Tax=Alkalimonas delamerensis TaxID=265981 RepID=A0ABT9GQA8_9GAMM|nr:cell division protein ZapD [Alkalimonas delamerensis]MDP4529160.1 cell division protein ZapD [Alkalimonas delamerensis]